MNRDLLGDHDDLPEVTIDTDEFCYAATHTGGRQVDDAGIEDMSVVKPLTHVVVNRYIADGRLQHLPAPPRRRPEYDVASGECVADRRHLPRFAAQDVEHADPVLGT